MSRRPLRIGLTGCIGSGKSMVAQRLRDLGAAVVDADAIAREVTAPGGPAYAAIVRAFGQSVLRRDGSLDRKALAARVFADDAARRQLNALTHPYIRQRMAEEAARLASTPGLRVIVFDIPLLLETTDGSDLGLEGIVVVTAAVIVGAGVGASTVEDPAAAVAIASMAVTAITATATGRAVPSSSAKC